MVLAQELQPSSEILRVFLGGLDVRYITHAKKRTPTCAKKASLSLIFFEAVFCNCKPCVFCARFFSSGYVAHKCIPDLLAFFHQVCYARLDSCHRVHYFSHLALLHLSILFVLFYHHHFYHNCISLSPHSSIPYHYHLSQVQDQISFEEDVGCAVTMAMAMATQTTTATSRWIY